MIISIAACLGGGTEIEGEKSEKKDKIYLEVIKIRGGPSLGSYWVEMPRVTFCRSSGVSSHRARSSVRYWQRLGYNIQKVEIKEWMLWMK